MVVMAAYPQNTLHVNNEDEASPGGTCKKTDLQQHLQFMFALLPQDHVLKEVVRLESTHQGRVRYLAVVAYAGSQPDDEEACVLGFDWIGEKTTLGLVLCIYADAGLTLDGDGGFSLCSGGSQHVFKPVSVHVLWAVIQSLHKACDRAQKYNHYPGGGTHRWVESYRITSDRSCLNEWNYLPDVESRRPASPQDQKADRERLIRSTLKEVMMTLDLDDVTSVDIRRRVEEELKMDLTDQKSFLDQEMLTILGQMDGASRIFDDLFLGSEWNASNLEELERNGIGHILNVTREIDNFFPDQFDYLNIRVYDDEATELLKHWDRTYKYIRRALEDGSKVLVHCKMGVSRSASVVIAYAMKQWNWDLPQALKHVKDRRACVKPNTSFMQQLETYAGILDASRQRHNKLWRSKSETNLAAKVSPAYSARRQRPTQDKEHKQQQSGNVVGSSVPNSPVRQQQQQISMTTELQVDSVDQQQEKPTEKDSPMDTLDLLEGDLGRPKSWSPDDSLAESYFPSQPEAPETELQESAANPTVCVSLRVPCSNGRTYSVSQNRAVKLESSPPPPPPPPPANFFFEPSELSLNFDSVESMNGVMLDVPGESSTDPDVPPTEPHFASLPRVGSVKDRIYELEAAASVLPGSPVLSSRPTGLVLNLKNPWHFGSSNISPLTDPIVVEALSILPGIQSKPVPTTSATNGRKRPEQEVKIFDVFSDRVDRAFEREERRQSDGSIPRESPMRQRSWGATETRSRVVPLTNPRPDSPTGMSSYSSDPSLPTIPSEEQQDSLLLNECSRGLVRMQREALEKANNGPSYQPQQRRSLPDESVSSTLLFSRSTSDTSSTEGISVMRLRKALEAKATCPLTGSFAPTPTVLVALAAAASSQSTQTSPTRQRLPVARERLRKRSLSLERMTYPSAQGPQDANNAAQEVPEEVDLNVKLLVGRFETPHRPVKKMERPRGWSESSLNTPSHPRPNIVPQRRSLAAKPPVPNDPFIPMAQLPRPAVKERKLYQGKTHPLDRLTAGARQQKLVAQPVFGTM
ncbi:uncharacterized protein LOC130704062 [Daphnia carinata]|uniref:uncharacterized protein LOC130704062 n=1 Tax=Daphnia carinata TaxID=120202 RepID=UPI00257F132B|nr:uncharacterized protein LOC130704062 [Daphnia carinata]